MSLPLISYKWIRQIAFKTAIEPIVNPHGIHAIITCTVAAVNKDTINNQLQALFMPLWQQLHLLFNYVPTTATSTNTTTTTTTTTTSTTTTTTISVTYSVNITPNTDSHASNQI